MNRSRIITVRVTHEEHERLSKLAGQYNLRLGAFAHHQLTRSANLSGDTAIVAGEIGRLGELVKRGFEKAGVDMREVCGAVNAIDARVFVAQLHGVNSGQ